MAVRNVIFDIGGVLAGFREEKYFEALGYDEKTAQRLCRDTMRSPFWKEYDRGVLSDEEILACFAHLDPEMEEEIRKSLLSMNGLVTKRDTAIPWIRSLKKKGYGVYYLSNFSATSFRDCAGALDFLPETDGGILSFRDGLIKPSPEIYELLLSRYRLKAEECVFIDDTFENLPMAKHLGIHTIQYLSQQQAERALSQLLS